MRSYLPNFHFIFYNFTIFTLSMTFIFIISACDRAGLTYPPATVAEAWSWEEFVAICQKLTTDRNGYEATNPNFEVEHIITYAVAFPQSELFLLPFIYSNGSQVASDDGQKLLLNQPAAINVLPNRYERASTGDSMG